MASLKINFSTMIFPFKIKKDVVDTPLKLFLYSKLTYDKFFANKHGFTNSVLILVIYQAVHGEQSPPLHLGH